MTSLRSTSLIEQANQSANSGDFQRAFELLTQAAANTPDEAEIFNGLGACLLQLGRPQEAISHFRRAAALTGGEAETLNNLGIALALAGRSNEAESAYRQALAADSNYVPAWKNLAQMYLRADRPELAAPILANVIRANRQDAEVLFLMGACYELGDEIESARSLYREALKLQPDQPEIQVALTRLNPVETTRIARPEHAQKLAALKSLKKPAATTSVSSAQPVVPASSERQRSMAFYGPGDFSEGARLLAPALALEQAGYRTKLAHQVAPEDLQTFDTLIISHPHLSPKLLEGVALARQAGKRVVIDIDHDFHTLPPEHPAYTLAGPGSPAALRGLEAALSVAGLISVSSRVLAERYLARGFKAEYVPSGWSPSNPLWDKPSPGRQTINLGWVGGDAQVADLAIIQEELVHLAHENPQVKLVLAGSLQAYEMFNLLPEARRQYLPPGPYEDRPSVLAHFDILLVPLRNLPYNQARSDLPLVEAGVRRLPWVASSIPAFQDWNTGGLLATSQSEWRSALLRLVSSPALRQELGAAARQQAEGRANSRWLAAPMENAKA